MTSDIKQKPGDFVEITTKNRKYTGLLIERQKLSKDNFLVIKLNSGYNIGIKKDEIEENN